MSRYRFSCFHWSLLAIALLATALPVAAARAYEPIDLKYLSEDAVMATLFESRRLLTSPEFEPLPVEVLQAFALQNAGVDPLEVEQMLLFVEAPRRPGEIGPTALVLRLSGPNPSGFLFESIPQLPKVDEIDGRDVYLVQEPFPFYVHMPDDVTLLIAFEKLWEGMVERTEPPETRLAQLMAEAGTEHDLLTVVSIDPVRDLLRQGVEEEGEYLPAELQGLTQVPELLDAATLKLNLTGGRPSSLELVATDAAAAEEFEAALAEMLPFLRETALYSIAYELPDPEAPTQQALLDYANRVTALVLDPVAPVREGDRITMTYTPGEGPPGSGLATLGTLGMMFMPRSLEGPPTPDILAANTLRQVMMCMHEMESQGIDYETLIVGGEEPPPLSWRVHILPYIGEGDLYEQFRLDEPWDSEHNIELVPQMPGMFRRADSNDEPGLTHIQAVVGEGTALTALAEGTRIGERLFGSVMFVEADEPVVWTKPADWQYDDEEPLAGLGELNDGALVAIFYDGHVEFIDTSTPEEHIRSVLAPASEE